MPPPVALRAPTAPKLVLARNALRASGGGTSPMVAAHPSSARRLDQRASSFEQLLTLSGQIDPPLRRFVSRGSIDEASQRQTRHDARDRRLIELDMAPHLRLRDRIARLIDDRS
jgi:hypothetical protein